MVVYATLENIVELSKRLELLAKRVEKLERLVKKLSK